MSRVTRRGSRPGGASRRRRGPSPLIQLGILVGGLVVLLSLEDKIASGTAGCFSQMASSSQGVAPVVTLGSPATGFGDAEASPQANFQVQVLRRDVGEVAPDTNGAGVDVGGAGADASGAAPDVSR